MKITNTFFYDNNGKLLKTDCKVLVHGKIFDCNMYDHFSRFAYINCKVEKRESYKYVGCTEIKEANMSVYTNEA